MGLASDNKNFPRGGRKPAVAVPRKGRFRLFGKPSRNSSHLKDTVKKRAKEHGSSSQLKVTHTEPLTLKTLSEGMLILGCVCEIQEYNIVVSLPGRLIGHVPITNISAPYTKYLQDLVDGVTVVEKVPQLNEIFHVGQAVVTRVIEINRSSEHNAKVTLSLVPDVVHSDWSPRAVTSGSIVIAAVKSQEENGYVMDTGIKNVRAFLKRSAALKYEMIWNQERPLGIGHLVRCLVTKSNVTSFTATVELSADPDLVKTVVADSEVITVDVLLPGTLLNASISKVLKNGLEVKFGQHFVGYVHKDHLSALWDTPQDYSAGDDILARVLYVLPTVKFIYLSLKKELCDPEAIIAPSKSVKFGDIVKRAKIEHVDSCGVTISIKTKTHNLKGFVSIHHCSINSSKPDDRKSLKEELNERLAVGTSHKSKVLGYDYMSQVFICTFDKRIIKAKFLYPKDLQPGMKVSCQIKEHTQTGVFVTIDGGGKSLTGFIRSFHLGNVPLQHPEKKYPVGSQHSARVLLVQGNKIQLTLKPVLLVSDTPPLHRFEDAQPGMLCEGVVTLIVKTGLLLTFYGDVKGWLELSEADRRNKYYIGQVLPCYVQTVDVNNGKLSLSLKGDSTTDKISKKRKKISRVGKMYKLSVTSCTEVALEVEGSAGSGIIPAQHLTDNPTLAQLLLSTYAPGDTINVAFCFSETDGLVFTVRPSLIEYFQSKGARKWSGVCEKMLLPCTVKSIMPKQVTLQLPLSTCNITDIRLKDLCSVSVEDATQLGLVEHQGLISRVVKVGGSHECVRVTTKLSDCWDYSTEACVSLLRSFWQDYDTIVAHMKEQGNPLASLVPGDRVKGEVIAVEKCGAVVRLESGVQGIATPELYKGSLKCGAKVEGTVLFIDFQNNCVELTVRQAIMQRINNIQDGKLDGDLGVGTGVRGEVLSVRQEMIVVVLKGAGRKQLAYIPSHCHMNDLVPDLRRYRVGETSKMIVQALEGGRIICVQQRFVFKLIKLKARAMVAAERLKRNADRTSQDQKCDMNNSDSGIQDLDTSEHEGNGMSHREPKVKGSKKREMYTGEGHDSCEDTEKECQIISNDGASGSEAEIEVKSEEESSDEDETAFLRKLNSNYANNASDEVQEMLRNTNVYVTGQKMKIGKKTKVYAGQGHDSCEDTEKECQIISNACASGSEPEIEVKSEKESSDEDETAILRKLNAKTMGRNYANNASNEVQEMLRNSDIGVTKQKMKGSKKREMYAGEGHVSCENTEKECHIISNAGAYGSEPEIEVKSEKESSDEDETAILRKLEVKTMKKIYANNTSNEVQEMSCNSNVDVTKSKKRQMSAEEIIEDAGYEGSRKKRIKTNVQNEVVRKPKGVDTGQMTRLSLTAGFVWNADPSLLPAATTAHKSDTSSDEEEVHKHEGKRKKLSRAERMERARQEEERLRAVEQKLMDSETGPQSADDFDRLVLSSPNSSLCWIKYMAFHLQATEIEKARAVAQRALSTISFREEQEKLNVWCALLNLENLYGSKESLDRVLEEAVRMNDPFRVYTQMLQIYADSGKTEEAEKLVSLLAKKFRDNKEAWLQGGEVLLKLGKPEKSRSLMQRALTSLDKKLHVEVISKFAHLENRLGEPERAQTLMEHILTSYPKRVDIWNSYVDMLVKNGQLEAARQVLERGVAQKLPARKMKSLFAKFLQFEEQHGTPEGVEKVRQMAVNYVEAAAGQVEEDND